MTITFSYPKSERYFNQSSWAIFLAEIVPPVSSLALLPVFGRHFIGIVNVLVEMILIFFCESICFGGYLGCLFKRNIEPHLLLDGYLGWKYFLTFWARFCCKFLVEAAATREKMERVDQHATLYEQDHHHRPHCHHHQHQHHRHHFYQPTCSRKITIIVLSVIIVINIINM